MRRLVLAFAVLAACGPHTVIHNTSAGGGATPHATSDGEEVGGDAPTGPPPQAWLWRISGGNARAPSYVLGTMHVGIRMPDALPPPYDGYLHDTRALVMEVDLREVERFMAESARTHHGTRSGRTLDRALGRESWDRLLAEMGQRVPAEILRRVPPGTMTLYLQQVRLAEVEAREEGRDPVPGVPSSARLDESIFEWAVSQGVTVVPLETPEQALAVLDQLPETNVLEGLHAIVDHPDDARAEVAALRAAYLSFDEEAILNIENEEWTPEARAIVLLQRNRAWEAALFPEIQRGNAFVAVGVGHLLGEGSVLEALAAQGYTVERLGGVPPS